jgi:hypothetical protein
MATAASDERQSMMNLVQLGDKWITPEEICTVQYYRVLNFRFVFLRMCEKYVKKDVTKKVLVGCIGY